MKLGRFVVLVDAVTIKLGDCDLTVSGISALVVMMTTAKIIREMKTTLCAIMSNW